LIGVARNVGASHIAQEARTLETEITTENPDLSPLRKAIDETLAFIRGSSG
jgi:hypothetical protein